METQEIRNPKKIFYKMQMPRQSLDPACELQLFSSTAKKNNRHPYVFCRICGKFGRKDSLTKSHPESHPYIVKSKIGFVKQNEEPNRDKYGHFGMFLALFGPQEALKQGTSHLSSVNKEDQIECQRFYWGKKDRVGPNLNVQDTNTSPSKNGEGQGQRPVCEEYEPDQVGNHSEGDHSLQHQTTLKNQEKQKCAKKIIFGTDQNQCGTVTKDMCKKTKSNQHAESFNQIKKKSMNKKQPRTKRLKTLIIQDEKKPKISSRELQSLDQISSVKQMSKKIKKSKKLKTFTNKKTTLKKQVIGDIDEPPKKIDRLKQLSRWTRLTQKLRTMKRDKNSLEVTKFWRDKYASEVISNRDEILDLNEQHKQLMLRERGMHCHLYKDSANHESMKLKLHNQMVCTRDQRNEINVLLTRLAKYAKNEVAQYPKNMMIDGKLDPHVWKLTREAATDEELIKDLKSKLEQKEKQLQKVLVENQDFKNQITYASNNIAMISQACSQVINNQMSFQQSSVHINNQLYQRGQPIQEQHSQQEPVLKEYQEVFEYCREEQVEQDEEGTSLISSNSSSIKKSVSFSPKSVIIGKKVIDPKNPKTCQDYYDQIKQRKERYRRKQIEKIRAKYPLLKTIKQSNDFTGVSQGHEETDNKPNADPKQPSFMTPDSKETLGKSYKGNFF